MTAVAVVSGVISGVGPVAFADTGPPAIPHVLAVADGGKSSAAAVKAGVLPGSSGVSPSGAFTYSMPLDVPAGRAGVAPKLTLEYVSGGGDGVVGRGWSLSGLSSTLSRCGKTVDVDGARSGVAFGKDDRFCLDGHELKAVASVAGGSAGVYGADGTEYRSPLDPFTRVVSHGGSPETGPDSFTVYLKDGRVRSYSAKTMKRVRQSVKLTEWHGIDNMAGGNHPTTEQSVAARKGDSSDVKAVWLLSSEKDHADNEMKWSYDRISGDRGEGFLVSRIDYTYGAGSKGASRYVLFDYEDRGDKDFSFVSGVGFESTKRLKSVRMFAPNPTTTQEVWRYNLSYRGAADGGSLHRSELDQVQKCGVSGGQVGGCLQAKKFSWAGSSLAQDSLPSFTSKDLGRRNPTGPDSKGHLPTPRFSVTLDVNGDGLSDMLSEQGSSISGNPSMVLELGKRDADGKANPLAETHYMTPPTGQTTDHAFDAWPHGTGDKDPFTQKIRPVDINGDGKSEVLVTFYDPNFVASMSSALMRWDNTNSKWVDVSSLLNTNVIDGKHYGDIDFGDVNGDGRPDLINWYFQPQQDEAPERMRRDFTVQLNTGYGNFGPVVKSNYPSVYEDVPSNVLDRPADSYKRVSTESRAVGDVDGDGRAEILTTNRNQQCINVDTELCHDVNLWTTAMRVDDDGKISAKSDGLKSTATTADGSSTEQVYSIAPFGDIPRNFPSGSSLADTPHNDSNLGKWSFKRGDFNGDGLEDSLAVPIRGSNKGLVLWNTGSGLSWDGSYVSMPRDDLASLEIGDINRDGYDDVVSFYDDGLKVQTNSLDEASSEKIVMDSTTAHQRINVALSTGHGGFINRAIDGPAGQAVIDGGRPLSRLGDFNGDGLLDLAEIDQFDYQGGGHERIYQQNAADTDVITSVRDEDASGASVAAEYSQQWSDDMAGQAARSCSGVLVCVNTGQRVVRKLTTQDTYDSDAKPLPVYYSYEDPQTHLTQGSMGFGKVIAWDPNRPSETVTTYDRNIHGKFWLPQVSSTVQRVPVLTQAQVAGKPATSKVRQTTTTYAASEDRFLNSGASLAVLPKGSTVTVSEGTMNLDWTSSPAKSRHITAGSADPAVLRTVSETLDHDDYGN
ncbi:FG-GAP repeat domain-containing protein, partial [Streptomyces sp. NPDC086783]|uniref:FG-GAP repeat domain-containing protein n=1 Tax=Streptomyces sp. NPDC086783 TaxID=3365758 RepID=UPI003807576D